MAERRMFAKTIIDSDAFIEMPSSAQALYFHLGMRADDDGFINNPNRVRKDIGASEDDLKLLALKRFIIPFESGVVVIKHWRIHNYIQSDRYKPTVHTKEMALLQICENRAYTECIHHVSSVDTQVRLELGKDRDRLGKDSIEPQQLQQLSVYSERAREKTAQPSLLDVHRLGKGVDNVHELSTGMSTEMSTQSKSKRQSKETELKTDTVIQQQLVNGAGAREEKGDPPSLLEVCSYIKGEFDVLNATAEAEKFIAWNAVRGWVCLPNWQAAVDLWCARIGERG